MYGFFLYMAAPRQIQHPTPIAVRGMDINIEGCLAFRPWIETPLPRKQNAFVKQTLLHSPIFTNIFPKFKVNVEKPVRGLASTSINDEADQTLALAIEDSQLDAFDDDDDLLMDIRQEDAKEVSPILEDKQAPEFRRVKVIIKVTSIVVEGIEFAVNAPIRSSCVVPGTINDEDSLFISLKSGFLLLIRLFLVPKSFISEPVTESNSKSQPIIKPFVVQWWDTNNSDEISSSGFHVRAHQSGLAAVSTSSTNVFRIYNCQHTDSGIMFLPHFNVPVDGAILNSCFVDPLNKAIIDNHFMFLTLQLSTSHRLELHLYSWIWGESITDSLEKSILPLHNSFNIPIFIIPLTKNASFLFVSPGELTMVSLHQITSAEFEFISIDFKGAFPTNYSISDDISSTDPLTDTVLLSTENGVVYLVEVAPDTISVRPILRVTDSISVFSLTKEKDMFCLIFGSDTGSNREVLIPHLFDIDYCQSLDNFLKIKYSTVNLLQDHRNWAPILDVLIIDSFKGRSSLSTSSEELWALTGTGKRTKLTQLKVGYNAQRYSSTYETLRKAEKIFFITLQDRSYLICALPFATCVLEYQDDSEDKLCEIEGPNIIQNETCLLIEKVHGSESLFIQVTKNRVLLSDLCDLITLECFDDNIVCCAIVNRTIAIAVESEGHISIRLFTLSDEVGLEFQLDDLELLIPLGTIEVEFQVSCLEIMQLADQKYLVLGDYDGNIYFFCIENGLVPCKKTSLPAFNQYDSEQQLVIADDIKSIPGKVPSLVIGSKDGFLIQLQITNNLEFKCHLFLKLADTPVLIYLVPDNKELIFVLAKNLWLVDATNLESPLKVYFEEKTDRAISAMVPLRPRRGTYNVPFAYVRDEGLTIGKVFPFKAPVVKQMSLGEAAKKILYMPYLSTFALLCNSKDPGNRLKFIDRKGLRIIPHMELTSGQKSWESIFRKDEIPISSCIWTIDRGDRISKKLLIGSMLDRKRGSLKILNIHKVPSEDKQSIVIKVTELNSFDHKEPINKIQQLGSAILFSSGKTIYSTVYETEAKRLRPINALQELSSEILSITIDKDGEIIIATKQDSIFRFRYSSDATEEKLVMVSSFPQEKSLASYTQIDRTLYVADKLHSTISMTNLDETYKGDVFTFRVPFIARVFANKFKCIWSPDQADLSLICIGVNGEVLSIRPTTDEDTEISRLMETVNTGDDKLLVSFTERLNRPFVNKNTGKGLRPIYRPYFDYKENQGKVYDYDIEEISVIRSDDICL